MKEQPGMHRKELKAIIFEVYGSRGQRKLANDIKRGEVTVSRWLGGITPIGETEALLLRMILVLHRKRVNWQKWLDDYVGTLAKPKSIEDLL